MSITGLQKSLLGVAVLSALAIGLPLSAQAKIVLSQITATNITETSAVISWRSSVAADSYVGYKPQAGGEQLSVIDLLSTLQHSKTLQNLIPGTTYVYEVNSASAQGDAGFVTGLTFTTKGTPPVQIPSYPTGTLAQEGAAIYFLMAKDKIKVPFTSMTAFTGLGYNLKNVKKLNLSSYKRAGSYALSSPTQEHPWGSWLKWKDGTLYYAGADGLIGVPSMSVFTANGGKPEMIVPLNAADDAVWAKNPKLPVLQVNDSRIL